MNCKRIYALLLVLAMLLTLCVGCSSKPAATPTEDKTTADTPETPAEEPGSEPVDEPAEEPAGEPAEEPAEEPVSGEAGELKATGTVELPLTDELTTLTMWRSWNPYKDFEDFNDSRWKEVIAEVTNVQIDFECVPSATASDKFSLMLVSQDYTDMMKVPNLTALKSGDAAVEDEILLDLRDYDSSLYPNYQALIDGDQNVYKMTRTDEGTMWGFFVILNEPEGMWTGPAYRKDLAEKAGYTGGDPVTLEQWETLLQAYKDYGVDTPLAFPSTGYYTYGAFATAFDAYPGFYAEDGKTVRYGFIENNFKAYLQQMTQWREKGYIQNDFYSWDLSYVSFGTMGNAGMGFYPYCMIDETLEQEVGAHMSNFAYTKNQVYASYGWTENADYYVQPVPQPALSEDQTIHLGGNVTYVQTMPLGISTACADPELAIRLCDFFYTYEGFLYNNYGIEGESYSFDENGEIRTADLLLHNPDGYELTNHKGSYWCMMQVVGLYTYLQSREDFADQTVYEAYDIWVSNYDGAWNMPAGVALTAEESYEHSSRFNDISTYVEENLARFILGELNYEEDWDNFVAAIKSMEIDVCIDIYQDAYDRYQLR